MLDLNIIPGLSDDMRFRIINDEALIVCQHSGEILALNSSGSLILQTVDGRKSVCEIIDAVKAVYDLPGEELERDVLEFLAEMLEASVLEF